MPYKRYSRYSSYYPPYVSVAERRRETEQRIATLAKKGVHLSPITLDGKAIATTFWGKAWCANMEHYSDYEIRLPRGRSYVRNGSVIDLKIVPGAVEAKVMGSSLYTTTINISALPKERWQALSRDCAGTIDSLVELLQGRLSKGVMERMCRQGEGLFPTPREIKFDCSCPDGAYMCKHVAAVLYGVGARLDEQPELLFTLRNVDAAELVAQASDGLPLARKSTSKARVLDDASLSDVFGIDLAPAAEDDAQAGGSPSARSVATPKPTGHKRAAAPAKDSASRIKKAPAKRKPPAKKSVPRKPAAKNTATKKSPVKKLTTQKPVQKKPAEKQAAARKIRRKKSLPP